MIAHRGIAQLVEYRSPKPWVAGSNPPAPAITEAKWLRFFLYTENPAIVAGFCKGYADE